MQFFWRVACRLATYPGGKNFVEMALFHSVSEINWIFAFNAEIPDGCQKWRENDFLQNVASRLRR